MIWSWCYHPEIWETGQAHSAAWWWLWLWWVDVDEDEIDVFEEKIDTDEDKIDVDEDEIDVGEDKIDVNEDEIDVGEDEIDVNEDEIAARKRSLVHCLWMSKEGLNAIYKRTEDGKTYHKGGHPHTSKKRKNWQPRKIGGKSA